MKRLTIPGDDILAVLALGLIAIGLCLLSIPLAFVVVGSLILIYAILPDQSKTEAPK